MAEKNLPKNNRLEILRSVSSHVAGKNTSAIVDILSGKENVNEFLIAKKLDLTINQIRNVLYKLNDEGLVSFVRKKDKKKGWYTYFWTFNEEKALNLMKKIVLSDIENLERELENRKSKRYYKSPDVNIEYSEERALELDFICPETGEVMELKDTSIEVKEIASILEKTKKKLQEIDFELSLIDEVNNKKAERKRKKEEKEKSDKKKEAARKRAETRKMTASKTAKKTTKKAVKKAVKKTTKKAVKKKTTKKK